MRGIFVYYMVLMRILKRFCGMCILILIIIDLFINDLIRRLKYLVIQVRLLGKFVASYSYVYLLLF